MVDIKSVKSRLPELDILRVIAAVFVLLYHFTFREPLIHHIPPGTFPSLDIFTRYGFLGVQLFFIISGFVILMSAEKRSAKTFIASRAKRICPALWISCTLTFTLTLLFGAPIYHPTWSQYFINMTLLSDILREYPIDGAYWSIFVEIKFYLFIFLVLIFKGIKKIELIYFIWILAVTFFTILPGDQDKNLNFLLGSYAPYFAMGSIFYLWWQNRLSKISYATFLIAYILTILEGNHQISILNENLHQAYYSAWIYNLTIAAFLAIFFLILRGPIQVKENQITLKLGLLTYPLYLVHQYIGVIIMKGIGYSTSETLSVLIATTLVIGIAYLVLSVETLLTRKFWPI
ncbi:acyltransferase family protein [Bdellovibrio svalbardensis]|uniref:Acyltransferase n=1 Tax=Bdellovibrio svalbardensis TaxID=2972972 RepID=A0ABT6DKH4_9BACT|nr:acyltransferase [Bdellovibrio svalbardensis]MDG0817362.1 acyltransferase [Bdellovibrio svalbardensis]